MSLRRELLSQLRSWDVRLPDELDDDAPLISSGAIDSLGLFKLVLWIEEKTGRSVDPRDVDLAAQWDSVRLILGYLAASGQPVAARGAARVFPPAAPAAAGARIVRYTPQHKAAVAELQTALWSPDPALNRAYLEWKYEQNPYAGEPRIYLALSGDELVGMRGFYRSRWERGSPATTADVLVADDFVVRADHRDRGLATQIMREALIDLRDSGSDYVFNLSGGRVTVLNSLAMGWRSAGPLAAVARATRARRARMVMRRALRRLPLAWRYADDARLAAGGDRQPFLNVARSLGAHRTAAGVTVRVESRPRPRDMAALVARLAHDGRLRHVRDERYLEWRFRNPRNDYRFLFVGDDRLHGYLALVHARASGDAYAPVCIADLEADSPGHRAALLDAAIAVGRFSELAAWTATRDPGLCAELARRGFGPIDRRFASPGDPCVLVRPVDDARLTQRWLLDGTPLLELESWDLRMLYSMAG